MWQRHTKSYMEVQEELYERTVSSMWLEYKGGRGGRWGYINCEEPCISS